MKKLLLPLAAVAVLLAACSHTSVKCTASNDYKKAISIDPITGSGDIKLAEAPSALKVPEITPAARAAAAQPVVAETKRAACLDYPPAIVGNDAATAATGAAK
jgi:uncharacterized lipoprotein